MDFLKVPGGLKTAFRKYRTVIFVILLGMLLMNLGESRKKPDPPPVQQQTDDLQQPLEEILESIQGAGNVKLLLSRDTGPVTRYKCDEQSDSGGYKKDTVIVTDEARREYGLVEQITAPRYRGAVVISQGADSPGVRLAIVKAVSSATGLGADKITVLRMK